MKRFLLAVALMMTIGNIPAFAADVGVSVSIGQPGFYGRIDIGNAPHPEYVNPQPIIVQPVPRGRTVEPIYLRVPPGHQKNWKKYCGKYNACGQPVYFVKDNWYNEVYTPHYKKQHGDSRDDNRGRRDDNRGKGQDRGNDRGHNKGRDRN
ncbi:MAG: hypothetical protein NT140_07910 [Deltaproteobacteria bacterium]|nr:hypothetical protein [Deltaproteobacteria bacterium]